MKKTVCFLNIFISSTMLSFHAGCEDGNVVNEKDGTIPHKKIINNISQPYEYIKVLSPNELLVKNSNNEEIKIILRGILPTANEGIDARTKFELNKWLLGRKDPLFLISDTIIKETDTSMKAVVLKPTTQNSTVDINTGKIDSQVINYVILQFSQLEFGECLLDRSDKDYWLYEAFERAEAKAKKKKEGYWKTHAE